MSRRRSLLKDKHDLNAFRHHRDRHLGHCVSNEFYQPTPFFFTRECAQLNLVGQYKGASAFLILNGPSLVSGDYDLSQMKRPGVITYGVNNGPATFRPNFWSCVDDPQRFLKSIWTDPTITKFVPHAHSEKPIFDGETWEDLKEGGKKVLVGECPNCVYFHRNEKFEAGRWLFEDKINWGNSGTYGGGRSVMLPALRILFLLGFRKVYLMGADFTMTEDYAYHFDERREKGAVKCNMNTYKKMRDEYFPSLQEHFKEEGFNVYNCNPDSGLKCFDHVNYNDAIAEATGSLGDVPNERTWGMYCKPGDKDKWKDEVTDDKKPHLKNLAKRDDLISSSRAPQMTPMCTTTTVITPESKEALPTTEAVVHSTQPIVQQPQAPKPQVRIVEERPQVEQIVELPQSPPPPGTQVSGEKKLIKHLPFRA